MFSSFIPRRNNVVIKFETNVLVKTNIKKKKRKKKRTKNKKNIIKFNHLVYIKVNKKKTYSRHVLNVNVTMVMSKITPTIIPMTKKIHKSLRPFSGNSINSIPDCIRGIPDC